MTATPGPQSTPPAAGPQVPPPTVGGLDPTDPILSKWIGYTNSDNPVANSDRLYLCEQGIAYEHPWGVRELLVAAAGPQQITDPSTPLFP